MPKSRGIQRARQKSFHLQVCPPPCSCGDLEICSIIQGASLRGRHTPPATLAQEGKIVRSGQKSTIDCKQVQTGDLKMPTAPPPCSRKTTQTPHARVYRLCIWYLNCIRDGCVCLSRSLWLQSFSRKDDESARTLGVLDCCCIYVVLAGCRWVEKNSFKHAQQAEVWNMCL